ncbi:MAG: RluA family pseudouridine synthase [Kiritimatiellia bacterium]
MSETSSRQTTVVTGEEPPVNFDVRWIYEDARMLVVDKPADLPVHPAGKYCQHTLLAWLHRVRPEIPIFHLLTRLDRETAGLILIARDPLTAKVLQRSPKLKRYRVIVEGEFPAETFCCVGTLRRDPTSIIRKKLKLEEMRSAPYALAVPEGSMAVGTWFQRIGKGPWAGTSWVEARLLTGRTHQIRATLLALGFPVVGDKIYGRDETCFLRFIEDRLTAADRTLLRLPNQALMAWQLEIEGHCFESVRSLGGNGFV